MSEFKPKIIPIDKLYGVFKDIAELIPKQFKKHPNRVEDMFSIHLAGVNDLFLSIFCILEEKYKMECKSKINLPWFEYPMFVLLRAFFELAAKTFLLSDAYIKDNSLEKFGKFALDVSPVLKKYKYLDPLESIDDEKCVEELFLIMESNNEFFKNKFRNKKNEVRSSILEELKTTSKPSFCFLFNIPDDFKRYENVERQVERLWKVFGGERNVNDHLYSELSKAIHADIHYLLKQYEVEKETQEFLNDRRYNYIRLTFLSLAIFVSLYRECFDTVIINAKDTHDKMAEKLESFSNENSEYFKDNS